MPAAPSITPGTARNLAVFIDADNLCDPTALDHVLTDVRQRSERVLYKRAYGRAESLKTIESVLGRHGVRPVANMIVNKVTTDSALVIDVVEAICTNSIGANPIDTVAICSGDADFVPLATWLRERGCQVWCFSLAGQIFANPENFYDDVVLIELVAAPVPVVAQVIGSPQKMQQPTPTPTPTPTPAIAVNAKLTNQSVASDKTQQVLKAFPQLRSRQPQHLNDVVAALRQQKILDKADKTTAWFRQYAKDFRLLPEPVPNRIVYCPISVTATLAPAASLAKIRSPLTQLDSRLPADPSVTLRKNTKLIALLRQAVQAAGDAQGWAPISVVRVHLGGNMVFDVKAHGFATLTKLFAATQIFELRGAGTPQVAVRVISAGKSKNAEVASEVLTWPSQHSRRPARLLSTPLHALRAVLLQVALKRLQREDVLQAVPELIFGAPCALPAVAGRLRDKGLLMQSQSALRIFERYPQSFVVDLTRYPQSVRHMGSFVS